MFKAAVISDLHFTTNKKASSVLVPGMAFAEEIADAILREVTALGPDVLIMTGDNTNSGAEADVKALADKLGCLQDTGTALAIIPGNHDFDRSDHALFEQMYFPMIACSERDAASLSYTMCFGDVVLLAMDDNAVHPGGRGEFSPATMRWLEQMLIRYKDKKVIFLSHHTVMAGGETASLRSLRIQNRELASLLEKYGVRLAFTGHLHSQILEEENGLYEMSNGMPLSGAHNLGILEIEGQDLSYHVEPVDFTVYGKRNLAGRLAGKEEEGAAYRRSMLEKLLNRLDLSESQRRDILELMIDFLSFYEQGTIAEHMEEIRTNPVFQTMIDALWDHHYGPWMKKVAESPQRSAVSLQFSYREQTSGHNR